jgi:hypothetical protein
MREELPDCLPEQWTTGTIKLFQNLINDLKKNISLLVLMLFLFSFNAFGQPPKIDLDQLRNGGNSGPPPGTSTSWVNGNLGSANSHYREGYSVPYRARLNNIPTTTTITVVFAFDIKHSGRNALDYLTYYRRNQPHTGWTPEHLEEAVNPLDGAQGSYVTPPTYAPIPCPTINASYIPATPSPQPSTSCNTLPPVTDPGGLPAGRQHDMTIWNGTIDSIRYVVEGDLNASQSEARIKVSFRATSSDVVLAWGGHIGSRIDWGYDADGVPRSAGGISGSPYHMRIISWGLNGSGAQDGSLPNLGNTDRSLSADAVARPPECADLDFTTNATNPLCPGTVNTYGVVINPLACTQPAYQWVIPAATNTSNAFIVGLATGQNIQVNSGTQCGSFKVQVTIICTEGTVVCDTTINVVDLVPPTLSITGHNPNAGCNPTSIPFGSASATDNCTGTVSITSTAGSITTSGCNRSQTMTWNAVDACNNSSSTSRTVSWIVDTEGPSIVVTGHNPNAGCNPTSIPFGTAQATDNCGSATLTSTAGSITTSGCNRSQTMTWNAVDACNNSSSTSRTVSWIVDTEAPAIVVTGHNPNAGCNPTSIPFGTAQATDNCGSATLTSTAGSITTSGCNRSQTMTWNAVDACNNSSSTSRTVSWIVDTEGPSIVVTGHNPNAGCNPTSIPFGTAQATDNCGSATLTSTAGSITTSGCNRSQTMTWNAVDACNNSSSTSRTVSWVVDTEGPSIVVTGHNPNAGCNPTSIPFGTAQATDNCGSATLTSTAGSITTSGCNRSQTMTWNAVDACNNSSSTSRTVSWIVDTEGPSIVVTGHNPNAGCNPTSIPFGTAQATDNCGSATLTSTAGSITTSGCNRSQTMTWNAVDACNNSSSTSRTVSWVVDTEGPSIVVTGHNPNAGCNPTSIPFGTAQATDNCGSATLTSTAGSITTSGCNRSQTMTWNAVDACNNSSSTSRTVSWVEDVTPPVITIAGYNANAGCNPTSLAFGTASATDNCGAATVTSSTGSVTSSGCNRSQTRFWTATDACNNSSSTSRTVSWVEDVTPPVIAIAGYNANAGCNPTSLPFGTASATDNCGAATVTSSTGSVTSSGCNRSQTRFWTATDACNNSSSTSRTVSWVEDVTPPVITIAGHNPNAGCNPTSLAFGTASATDNCGAATVTSSTGSVTSSGCNRSQTRFWTATDACNNSSSTSRTVSWVEDRTPPTFTNPPASVDLECYQSVPTVPTVTATDNCGSATVVYNGETDVPANCSTGFQRIITRSWTATDACGNTATHTQTIRVKCCVPVCTLTQGGYGQYGGTICLPNGTTVLQHSLMATALDAEPGDSVVFGRQSNNRYWVVTLGDVNQGANSNILKMLPGGGGSSVLGLDTYPGAPKYTNTPTWPVAPLAGNGKIRNILLAQTITFYFNTKIAGSGLGSIILNGDSAIISQRECGTNNPIPGTRDTVALISQAVASYMATHGYTANAAGLLQLANDALGGVNISPLSLGDVTNALDRINNVFDNCVLFEGYVAYVAGRSSNPNARVVSPNDLNVIAFPNPYEDQNFALRINAPVSGEATIQFFTIDGQQITQMKRTIVANKDEVVNFKVPGVQKSKIAYVVTIGKYNSKGIVLSPN